MATTLSKKLPDMPKGNWKAGLKFSPKIATKEKAPKVEKPKKEIKKTPIKPSQKPIKKTPIKKVGARKKKRISEYGTESAFFARIWEKRVKAGDIWCDICGEEVKSPVLGGKLIRPECFAHKLAKGMYPNNDIRYLEENIGVVCSAECHHKQDEMYNDLEVRNNMEREFLSIIQNRS
jgi:hypothetical protein